MTAQVDFTMVRGDTKKLSATVRDEAGAVVNLTGATIRWWLAKTITAPAPRLLEKAIGTGITVIDAPNGRFDVLITAANSAGISPGTLYHECEITDATGQVSTVFRGALTLERDLIV